MKPLALVLSILCLVACELPATNTDAPPLNDSSGDSTSGSNGDGTGDGTGDSTGAGNGDGAGDGTGDAAACTTPDQLSAVSPVLSEGFYTDNAAQGGGLVVGSLAVLDDSATPDILAVELAQGYGVFTEALQTGTFEIAGAETSLADCGACIYMLGDLDPAAGARQFFMAQSGTITIESVPAAAGEQLTGSIENVTLSEITRDPVSGQWVLVPDGCQSTLDQLSFDVAAADTSDEPAPESQP
ncbi:MAG: hypothetical protein AAGC55_06070 [Myxococcota bacterium]